MDALAPIPGGPVSAAVQAPSTQGGEALEGTGYSLFPSLADLAGQGAAAVPATVGSGPGASLTGLDAAPASTGGQAVAPSSLAPLIDQVAQAHGLPPSLLTALVQEESGFDPDARSSAGAMGLTQLMPGTAAALGVTDPWDAAENLNGGATYLAGLLQDYNGDVSLALAAYNAGPGAVTQWGGIPPYPQTQAYVRNVMALAGLSPSGQPTQADASAATT